MQARNEAINQTCGKNTITQNANGSYHRSLQFRHMRVIISGLQCHKWAQHSLCELFSFTMTPHTWKWREVHLLGRFDMNLKSKHTLIQIQIMLIIQTSFLNHIWIRVMKASVWRYSAWIKLDEQWAAAGRPAVMGSGGCSVLWWWGGVRPQDSDYILRPVQGDWDQDCKPKHYLCCSGT